LVQLKGKGRELFKRISVDVEEFWETTIGRLSTKDQVELIDSLRKLKEVMEQSSGPSFEEIHEGQLRGLEAEIKASTRRNLEEILSDMLKEIGLLLILARSTEEDGKFESTAYLRQMAAEQMSHAFRVAQVLGYVDDVGAKLNDLMDTKMMLESVKEKTIEAAREEGCEGMVAVFEDILKDDRKHRHVLEDVLGLLESKA
jgi:hypothetical protein